MTKIAKPGLGKRLPAGSEFVTVGDLFDLPPEEHDSVEVLLSSVSRRRCLHNFADSGQDLSSPFNEPLSLGSRWMSIESLLKDHNDRSSSLRNCPSGMVVVARRIH